MVTTRYEKNVLLSEEVDRWARVEAPCLLAIVCSALFALYDTHRTGSLSIIFMMTASFLGTITWLWRANTRDIAIAMKYGGKILASCSLGYVFIALFVCQVKDRMQMGGSTFTCSAFLGIVCAENVNEAVLYLLLHLGVMLCAGVQDDVLDLLFLLCCDAVYLLAAWMKDNFIQSAKKTAEANLCLERSFDGIRRLLGSMVDGYVLLSKEGSVVGCDQRAASLLGLTRGDLGHTTLSKWASDMDGSFIREGLRTATFDTATGGRQNLELYFVQWPLAGLEAQNIVGEHGMILGNAEFMCSFRIAAVAEMPSRPTFTPTARIAKVTETMIEQSAWDALDAQEHAGLMGLSGVDVLNAGEDAVSASDDDNASEDSQLNSASQAGLSVPGFTWLPMRRPEDGWPGYESAMKLSRTSKMSTYQVRKSGTTYLLKEVSLKAALSKDFLQSLKDVSQELLALKEFQWANPVLISLRDSWLLNDFSKVCLVLDFLPRTLEDVLNRIRGGSSQRSQRDFAVMWSAQITAGLAALHSEKVCHSSLSPNTVLVSQEWSTVKISDIHLRKPTDCDTESAVATTLVSSMASSVLSQLLAPWDAPELSDYSCPDSRDGGGYSCEGDMWALGVITAEILTLKLASELVELEKDDDKGSSDVVAIQLMHLLAESMPERADLALLAALMGSALCHEPNRRPKAREMLVAPIFAEQLQRLTGGAPEFESRILCCPVSRAAVPDME